MPKSGLHSPPGHRLSFFVFSRLKLQPDGALIARSCGIYRAATLEEALAAATIDAHSRGPLLFRLEQIIKPEEPAA